jgi:hypothetical protein
MFTDDALVAFALLLALAFAWAAMTSAGVADRRFFWRCLCGHLGGLVAVLALAQPLGAFCALVAS